MHVFFFGGAVCTIGLRLDVVICTVVHLVHQISALCHTMIPFQPEAVLRLPLYPGGWCCEQGCIHCWAPSNSQGKASQISMRLGYKRFELLS